MNHDEVRGSTRRAGDVKRYHEWPTIRTQTVAEHSWNVARIWLKIFQIKDRDSGKILRYILFHDCGELGVGDVPFPAKRNNPVLKAEMDRLEAESLAKQGVEMPDLTEWEQKSVKLCDLTEMAEFGHNELMLGSSFGRPVVQATLKAVGDMLEYFHEEDQINVRDYIYKSMGYAI